MNASDLIKFYESIELGGINWLKTHRNTMGEMEKCLNKMGEKSMELLLEKISEERLEILIRTIQGLLLQSLYAEGKATSLLKASSIGELQPYTHTIILVVIGILIDEEVL